MSTCIVCSTATTKYKCPKCLERYCSVACCKAHKESCAQQRSVPVANGPAQEVSVSREKNLQVRDIFYEVQNEAEDDVSDDMVPEELLQRLGQSAELKSALGNPHLRAMMENLVNTDRPEEAIAHAMHEPIFTEFADVCLQIVDRSNPNLEQEDVS